MPGTAKASRKGWIVIPKELRDRYGISPGDRILVTEVENGLLLRPLPADPTKSFRGMLKGHALVEALTESRQEDVADEELRAQ